MRIDVVASSLGMGGAQKSAAWLASRCAEAGHQVRLILANPTSVDFFAPDPRVAIVRMRPLDGVPGPGFAGRAPWQPLKDLVGSTSLGYLAGRLPLAWRFQRCLRQSRPELVVSFGANFNVAVMIGAFGAGVPVIISERGDPFVEAKPKSRRQAEALLFGRARAVVVLSDEILGAVEERWGCRQARVIPNAVTLRPGALPAMRDRPPVVVCVGRMSPEKGQPGLLDAWARTAAARSGWTLKLVGDGPLRAGLEAQVERLGLRGSVALVPPTRDVAAVYAAASVFVLPSLTEGFPNALLEAITCGCACVATRCSGSVPDMLDGGSAGRIVPVGDREALAGALDALAADAGLRARLGAAAQARSRVYDEASVFARWSELIDRCGGAGDRTGPPAAIGTLG